jgi:hypothetical protein
LQFLQFFQAPNITSHNFFLRYNMTVCDNKFQNSCTYGS